MKKLMGGILVVVLILGMSTIVAAWGGMGRQGKMSTPLQQRRFMAPCDYLLDEINLTEEQEEELEGLWDEHRSYGEGMLEELAAKREELYELYFDKTEEDAKIISLQNELNKLRSEMMETNNEFRLQLRSMLSAEQLEKLQNLPHYFGRMSGGFYHPGHHSFQKGRGF